MLLSEAFKAVNDDVWMSSTFDLPVLRYSGPQSVFIYDDLRSFKDLKEVVGEGNFHIPSYSSQTTRLYTPFKDPNSEKFKAIVPSHNKWREYTRSTTGVDFKKIQPYPISGWVVELNVNGLMRLDTHYSNGNVFRRKKVPVKVKGIDKSVWMYFTLGSYFSYWEPHENIHTIRKDINPTLVHPKKGTLHATKDKEIYHL